MAHGRAMGKRLCKSTNSPPLICIVELAKYNTCIQTLTNNIGAALPLFLFFVPLRSERIYHIHNLNTFYKNGKV